MAVQPRMGLLSEWRCWAVAGNSDRFDARSCVNLRSACRVSRPRRSTVSARGCVNARSLPVDFGDFLRSAIAARDGPVNSSVVSGGVAGFSGKE